MNVHIFRWKYIYDMLSIIYIFLDENNFITYTKMARYIAVGHLGLNYIFLHFVLYHHMNILFLNSIFF